MRITKQLLGGAVVLSMLVPIFGIKSTASAKKPNPNNNKVTICHRHNSVYNPYNQESVSESAINGIGNGDHYKEHQGPLASSLTVAQQLKNNKTEWGDIIPPLAGFHNGLNWTAEGQTIYNNNCNYVDYFKFDKKWTGDQVNTENLDVSFKIGETTWNLGDSPIIVKPGQTLAPITEEVSGLPEECTYTSDVPGEYKIPGYNDDLYDGRLSTVYDGPMPTGKVHVLEVTNNVDCEETEGRGSDDSSTTTTVVETKEEPQVAKTPVGPVNAGGGGASQTNSNVAILGLIGSFLTTAVGLLRKFNT